MKEKIKTQILLIKWYPALFQFTYSNLEILYRHHGNDLLGNNDMKLASTHGNCSPSGEKKKKPFHTQ